jgi:membrane protein DedA with SNARE-associated domain
MDLSGVFVFIQNYDYFIAFVTMMLGGPIAVASTSFLASIGWFNIFAIYILALLGNLIPDLVLFNLGKIMRIDSIEKLIYKAGLSKKNLKNLESNLRNHTKKAIVLVKLTPLLSIPSILLAGFLKLPAKRFFSISIIVDFVNVTLFVLLGYFSGFFGWNILKILNLEKYIAPVAAIFFILLWLFIKKIMPKIIKVFKKKIE